MKSEALDRARARNRNRRLPLNHGLPWSDVERRRLERDARLCRDYHLMDADTAIRFLAPRHKRTRCAIYCRLFDLGLVEGPFNENA